MLGVFQEATGQPRMQRVGSRHRGREVVDDQVLGDAAEEGPGRFQARDYFLQLLAAGGPDEAVPGVGQHHQQRPHRTAAAGLLVLDVAQPTEVQLRHLPRRDVLHPHRGLAQLAPVPLQDETPQRRVGHRTAAAVQQLLDARHLQPVNGEPPVDLVPPGLQQVLARGARLPRSRTADPGQPAQLVISGSGAVPGNAFPLRRGQVPAHCISRYTSARRNLPLAVPRLPTTNDFLYLHSENLPVRHRCTSLRKCRNGRRFSSQSGLMTLKIWPLVPENLPVYWPLVPEKRHCERVTFPSTTINITTFEAGAELGSVRPWVRVGQNFPLIPCQRYGPGKGS